MPVRTPPPEAAATPTVVPLFGRSYLLMVTNAPRRYDWSTTLTLYSSLDHSGHGERYVLIEAHLLPWHQGRYASGLYWAVAADVWSPEAIIDRLRQKIDARFGADGVEEL